MESPIRGDADDGATKESLGKALKETDLTEISSGVVSSEEMEESVLVFILREGYVLARLWPEHKYCAFDDPDTMVRTVGRYIQRRQVAKHRAEPGGDAATNEAGGDAPTSTAQRQPARRSPRD